MRPYINSCCYETGVLALTNCADAAAAAFVLVAVHRWENVRFCSDFHFGNALPFT